MPKKARVHFVSLHSSLVNLPISIYGPLVERGVRPQYLGVHLTLVQSGSKQESLKCKEAYVGWTGMASASSLSQFNATKIGDGGLETIEIDPQFAQGIGLAQWDIVDIGLLHDLPHANMVMAEPVTPDDWEIVEIHSRHVEGTLLSQVRVAKIGQEIDVWVFGRTLVKLRVTGLEPKSQGDAVVLTTNTEISIAPNLHQPRASAKQNGHGNRESTTTPSPSLQARTSEVLRILPARLSSSTKSPEDNGSDLIGFVSSDTLALLQSENNQGDSTFIHVSLRRLRSPLNPSSTGPDRGVETSTQGSRLANGELPSKSRVNNTMDVYVGIGKGFLAGHIVFPVLPAGLEEWDLVSISPATSGRSLKLELPLECPSRESRHLTLVGFEGVLEHCRTFCVRELLIQSLKKSCHGFSGLLVTGPEGSGKTSVVNTVAKLLEEDVNTLTYIHYVDVSAIAGQSVSSVKAQFHYWFEKCAWHAPSILVLDNLDKLLSAEVEHADSFRSRHLTELFLRNFSSCSRTASANSRGILLIATAHSTTSLHTSINSSHMFKEHVHLTPPTKQARRDILEHSLQERLDIAEDISISSDSPVNLIALATETEGYSAADLKDLVSRAFHQVAMKFATEPSGKLHLTHADFVRAQVDFVPLTLRNIKLQKSEISWSDIGGLHEPRHILLETLEWPTKYRAIFKQAPLRLRSGILLYGYPGCGKTLLASAVAKECGLSFISVKGPEILNKYIGASENAVRDLFERANSAKPCVLFFDEFDSLAPKRGHDSTGVTDRVVNQMLTQMDGAEGLDGVYVLAATSRPDLIDPALLRPGRLDKSVFCNMPTLAEREDILNAVAKKLKIGPDVNFPKIAEETEGFSGADLQALLYNAHLDVTHSALAEASLVAPTASSASATIPLEYAVLQVAKSATTTMEDAAFQQKLLRIRDNYSQPSEAGGKQNRPKINREIKQSNILEALRSTHPSISSDEYERLRKIYNTFTTGSSYMIPTDGGLRVTLG